VSVVLTTLTLLAGLAVIILGSVTYLNWLERRFVGSEEEGHDSCMEAGLLRDIIAEKDREIESLRNRLENHP
jgi:hypothetical protein